MTALNDYQEAAKKTAIYSDMIFDISHFGFGLAAEAGEVATILQKFFRKDPRYFNEETGAFTQDAIDKLKLELGDVLWFTAILADTFEFSLEEIGQANLAKLASRTDRGVIKGDGDNR